uniref:Uncharacterized protein n=1 Tax=viral metagenome TaxID=1070528 RepID=A0A6C0F4S5_9ZZZZ
MDELFDDENVNERIGEDIDYEESNAKVKKPNMSEDATKLAYREALNSFYRYKNSYEDAYNKMKNKIINNTELSWKERRIEFQKLKPKCINCKRPVGSIFTIKQNRETLIRDLHAMCGDRQDPCRFSIQIAVPYTTTYVETLKIDRDDINAYKNEIIKYKNDMIFGYLPAERAVIVFEQIREDLTSAVKRYEGSLEFYLDKTNSREKRDHLRQLTADLYININDLKTLMNEFDRSGNVQFAQQAVAIYINDILPKVESIREEKYAYSAVEYDSDDDTYHLVQKKMTIEQQQDNLLSDREEVVKHFTVGVGKNLKMRKSRRKTALSLGEEEEALRKRRRMTAKNRGATEFVLEEEEPEPAAPVVKTFEQELAEFGTPTQIMNASTAGNKKLKIEMVKGQLYTKDPATGEFYIVEAGR